MINLEIKEAITMRKIYSEEYVFSSRGFRIVAFREKSRITVKIYEMVEGKVRVIPQFEASLRVHLDDDGDVSRSAMFQRIIEASKLFLQNFQ